jgi:hypothetical protein
MSTFTNFAIRHEYASLAALGDRLGEVSSLIDWEAFRPLLAHNAVFKSLIQADKL